MGKTYYLDLTTLMSVLGDGQYILTTSLVISGTSGIGSLTLSHGTITECSIKLANARHLTGEQALRLLQVQTQWQVQFVEEPVLPVPPVPKQQIFSDTSSTPSSAKAIRQKKTLTSAVVENLTVQQRLMLRTVLAMINGHRTAEQIKALLNLPHTTVDEVLDYLRFHNIIE